MTAARVRFDEDAYRRTLDERAVKTIGRPLSPTAAPSDAGPTPARSALTHIRDLLAEPDEAVNWIVDGLLPAGGLSILGGKPKCGKTTMARAMALRVSRGESALGRTTERGPVIYMGLEDSRRLTREHLRTLGAREDDDLYVFAGTRPEQAVLWLQEQLEKVDPVLVVVDTLQALLGVSDLNDYSVVTAALNPILALVRPRRAHLQFIHHAGKGERIGFDSLLGSTALQGVPDVILLMRRKEDQTRTLTSLQRSGTDLPESVVTLDDHREPQLGPPKAEYEMDQMGEGILDYLTRQTEWQERIDVLAAVEGATKLKVDALDRLYRGGKVERQGEGKKGKPYLFRIIPFCRSAYTPRTEKRNPETPDNAGRDRAISVLAIPGFSENPETPRTESEEPDTATRAALREGA